MTDINNLNLSDEPLEGIDEAIDSYGTYTVIEPGSYNVVLQEVNLERFYTGVGKNGRPYALLNDSTWKIVGGEFDGLTLDRQQVNVFGWLKASGVKERSPRGIGKALQQATDTGRPIVAVEVDWQGRSYPALQEKLIELTGADTFEEASAVASKEQRREAERFALVAKRARDFPPGENGKRQSEMVCPHTHERVVAKPYIRTFVAEE